MKRTVIALLLTAVLASTMSIHVRAFAPSPEVVMAIEAAQQDDSDAIPDSIVAFPDKMPAKSTWEHVVSVPGYILYSPFWLTFKMIEGSIHFVEQRPKTLGWTQVFFSADGSRRLYPTFEPRYGAGAVFFLKHWPDDPSRLEVSSMFGLRGRNRQLIRHRRIGIFNDAMVAGYRLRYQNLPEERFFGIGPNTTEAGEAQFGQKMALAEITLGKLFYEKLQADVIVAMEHNIIADGNNPDGVPGMYETYPDAPGLGEELTLVRFGFGLELDARNQAFRPSKGTELAFRGGWIQDATDTDFGLSIVGINISHYVEPARGRVVIFRVAGEFADPLPGRETPFYWLPELGRIETIRGMTRGRYRDNDLVLASLEYRWAVSTFGDALLFVDTGEVSANVFNDFRIDDLQWTYGGGYRIWLPDGRTALRAEVGVSKERIRLHFVFNG